MHILNQSVHTPVYRSQCGTVNGWVDRI